ncbi:MAG: Maf family protein [Patescibacteria group bacterium]|nr:Maf family protein [Patescibacteria group bacterium]MDD5164746.1 Maf family protein [Patescibacteria group bacterium]MDD5534579.1 Maf family protein [Patescibacteria group bacterium]
MNIILGSASKSRKRVMERAGWKFTIITADIDEKAIRFDDPKDLVMALASAKADAILPKIKEKAFLITADQVVVCNNEIREKPIDEKQAREYLRSYADYPAEAVNGIAIVNTETKERMVKLEISKIKFKQIPETIIDQLISKGDIFSQAGSFSAEDPLLIPYIDYIEGTLDSVEGLPIELIEDLINKMNK